MQSLLERLITKQDIADIAASENLILDDEDRIAILESMESIDVQACPGSGKTTLIATKLILLAKKWRFEHRGICVLSHTNVAKDEIIERLKNSKTIEAQRLLSYPHFIGTIQEFMGKYIAFPLIRSDGTKVKLVDTDNCVNLIYANLRQSTRTYIDNKSQYSNALYDFNLSLDGTSVSINVPTFPNGSTSQSYNDLKAVRERMIAEGYYFYRDIYIFAEKALIENEELRVTLCNRFPCAFFDEMQDTQKYQDELLLQIFPLDEPEWIVQRFGDPDQAIFHGIGGEEANSSFNGKSVADMDYVVNKSHRFTDEIALKIRGVSFNQVLLETELSDNSKEERKQFHADGSNFEHTLIIYRDETRGDVIPKFSDIVSRQFSEMHKRSDKFCIKVVGAVGNEIDPEREELKIGHYWVDYDKTKAKNNFKEDSFIEAVYYCRKSSSDDWAANYKLLTKCILTLLRSANKKDTEGKYFTGTSMREYLKDKDGWDSYRKLIHMLLSDDCRVDQEFWNDSIQVLVKIFEFDASSSEADEYLAFHEVQEPAGAEHVENNADEYSLNSLPESKIRHRDGFLVEVSTIHAVKGETHDATLVLETKNHCFDLETMIPYLTGDLPNHDHPNVGLRENPHHSASFRANQKFMRQFYVAMSRPKHLLCLAVHSDRITQEQRASMEVAGWQMRDLVLDSS